MVILRSELKTLEQSSKHPHIQNILPYIKAAFAPHTVQAVNVERTYGTPTVLDIKIMVGGNWINQRFNWDSVNK